MTAFFWDRNGKFVKEIENYDLGNQVGIYPEATENGYYLRRRLVSKNNQILHFVEGFKGYPETLNV